MYEDRIERGASILDEVNPGWELEIDPATLDLQNACNCVLGQLYETFYRGLDHTGLIIDSSIDCGFYLRVYGPDLSDSYRTLTNEWITFIKKRLDEGISL